MGFVTLPPLVLASLPLGWDQRTRIPTEELHPMTCMLGFPRHGQHAARSMAQQEQLRIVVAAPLQRFAQLQVDGRS